MIYAIGDSFTYGDELLDRNLAWPAVLGQQLDREIINLGKNGSGNSRIVKRVLDLAFDDTAELILIAWAGPGRIEYFNNKPLDIWPAQQVRGILSPTEQELTRLLTLTHNEQWDIWAHRKWIRDIILCQNLLENQNKRYLMMVAWHNWQPTPEVKDLWDKVDTQYFLGYPTDTNPDYETFCYWFADAPKGPGGHPLELGHQRIADKIYEHIRNLGWLS